MRVIVAPVVVIERAPPPTPPLMVMLVSWIEVEVEKESVGTNGEPPVNRREEIDREDVAVRENEPAEALDGVLIMMGGWEREVGAKEMFVAMKKKRGRE